MITLAGVGRLFTSPISFLREFLLGGLRIGQCVLLRSSGFEELPIRLGSCSARLGHFSGCKFEVAVGATRRSIETNFFV